MKFFVNKKNLSLVSLWREVGYRPRDNNNAVRLLSRDRYPRFHIYFKKVGNLLECKLHLDQKKVSYPGQTAHSGDYDDKAIEKEVIRIKGILNS